MRDVLLEQLRRFPQYRTIIECAACACDAREFRASIVADALGIPRLELLRELDCIDRETSILYDVRDRDDAFAFQSSLISVQDEASGRYFVAISLPSSDHEQRRQQLGKALRLMESEPNLDYVLLSRIMGALAEELILGSAEDRQEASRLLERRLSLNETHGVGDPHGQAQTHGGLGRLAFHYEPQDLAEAIIHFQKALDISEAIGERGYDSNCPPVAKQRGLGCRFQFYHLCRSWRRSRRAVSHSTDSHRFACSGRDSCAECGTSTVFTETT